MSDPIDVDKLKLAAASRRTVTTAEETPLWQCQYCRKGFIHETSFMKHYCKEKRRHEELRSVTGTTAYAVYGEWMKLKRFKVPSVDAFATSKLFTSFFKFAEHIKRLNLSNTDLFIRLMVERDISPTLWTRSQCYSIYLEYYDNMQEPMEQVINSIEVLLKISEDEHVELSNLFNHLGVHRISEMVSLRKLTPWLLFCAYTFRIFLAGLEDNEKETLSNAINPGFWAKKLEEKPKLVSEIIDVVTEIGI
jgi:hypothetical protein